MVLFKSVFQLKIHQNNFFYIFFFIFDINILKLSKNTYKNINLMFFHTKKQFEKQVVMQK